MQTITSIKTTFFDSLRHLKDEVDNLFFYALESIHNLKRSDFILNPNFVIKDQQFKDWQRLIKHLKQNRPIQYFFGTQNFYGFDFKVNENTLIPRPETEELVEWIINNHQNQKIKILDIGTGSGCIAITLAKYLPMASVSAIDLSTHALDAAKINAKSLNANVQFIQSDLLLIDKLEENYDLIVSNPPYIRNLEKKEILPNVLDNEPHLALFVPNDNPLLFYDKILSLAKFNLNQKGCVYFEINQYLGNEMIELFEKYNFENITLKKDLKGNNRMISNFFNANDLNS